MASPGVIPHWAGLPGKEREGWRKGSPAEAAEPEPGEQGRIRWESDILGTNRHPLLGLDGPQV